MRAVYGILYIDKSKDLEKGHALPTPIVERSKIGTVPVENILSTMDVI